MMNKTDLIKVIKNLLSEKYNRQTATDGFTQSFIGFVERALDQGVETGDLEKYLDEHLDELQKKEEKDEIRSYCWQNRDSADYIFIERNLARTWIYEQKYFYFKEKGVMFYDWDYKHDLNQWYQYNDKMDWLKPPVEIENTYFLNPVIYKRSSSNFSFPKCKVYQWWKDNLSQFEHGYWGSNSERESIFPVPQDFIAELISKVSKNAEYEVKR